MGGTLYVDRALLRRALTDTEDFGGLLGTLSCDDFGDCGTGEVSIFHHTDPSITDPTGLKPVYPYNGDRPADQAPALLQREKEEM